MTRAEEHDYMPDRKGSSVRTVTEAMGQGKLIPDVGGMSGAEVETVRVDRDREPERVADGTGNEHGAARRPRRLAHDGGPWK